MEPIRMASIGTSPITERCIDAMADVEGIAYVACHSRSYEKAQSFGEAHGATLFFDSYEALAASSEIDAVYIATPTVSHARLALQMLESGKHVLVEKSFCSNLAEARSVFEVAQKHELIAMEAMRNLYHPGFGLIKGALPQLGRVRQASIRFGKRTSRMPRLLAGERLSVFDPQFSSGSLTDIGVYCIEPAIELFGAPDTVQAALVCIDVPDEPATSPYKSIDVSGELLLSYKDGESGHTRLVVNISYGKTATGAASSELQGDDGVLAWDETNEPQNIRLIKAVDAGYGFAATRGEEQRLSFEAPRNDMSCELAAFAAAVRGDAAACAAAEHHREVTLASLAVMDEARAQAGVRFPADNA